MRRPARLRNIARGAAALAAVVLLPGSAFAAAEEKETLYEVELLVFEQRLPDLVGDELFPDEPRVRSANDKAVAVEPAATGASRLAGLAALMEHDPRYRILARERWLQPSEPKPAAKPRRIRGAQRDAELDGNVRFYTTRFLHLDAHLTLRVDGRSYFIGELRRLRLNDLHYFDHPRFGMLARISQPERDKPQK